MTRLLCLLLITLASSTAAVAAGSPVPDPTVLTVNDAILSSFGHGKTASGDVMNILAAVVNGTSQLLEVELDGTTASSVKAFSSPFTPPVEGLTSTSPTTYTVSDGAGGFYVTGVATKSYTLAQFFVARVNSTGATTWTRWMNSTNDPEFFPNYASVLMVDPETKDLLAAGSYQGPLALSDDLVLQPLERDSADAFVARFDASTGKPLWATGFGNHNENGLSNAFLAEGDGLVFMTVDGLGPGKWSFAGSGGSLSLSTQGSDNTAIAGIDVGSGKAEFARMVCECYQFAQGEEDVASRRQRRLGRASGGAGAARQAVGVGADRPEGFFTVQMASKNCTCGDIHIPFPPTNPTPGGLDTFPTFWTLAMNLTRPMWALPFVNYNPEPGHGFYTNQPTYVGCGELLFTGSYTTSAELPTIKPPPPYSVLVGPSVGPGNVVIPGYANLTVPAPAGPNRGSLFAATVGVDGAVKGARTLTLGDTFSYGAVAFTSDSAGCATAAVLPAYSTKKGQFVNGTALPSCSSYMNGYYCGDLLSITLP